MAVATVPTVPTRVLVIDDEAAIRLLCRVNLEADGMEVLEAADGRAGLDLARAKSPDVILLDVMMPGLDSWQVAQKLMDDERTRSAAIVFLSGRAELRDEARALGFDSVECVTKPFDPSALAAFLRGVLERAETISPLRKS